MKLSEEQYEVWRKAVAIPGFLNELTGLIESVKNERRCQIDTVKGDLLERCVVLVKIQGELEGLQSLIGHIDLIKQNVTKGQA